MIKLPESLIRYSGLRSEDYTDLVDRLTAQYSVEIGPSRDRPSTLRHESWVYASGGAIRGLTSTKDGQLWVRMKFMVWCCL